jgi:hypothetical protein
MTGATILVTAVGGAEGARTAAAALACADAEPDRASLLVDLGGRPPRPTLLASTAARELEERLAVHLPQARVASRGQVCHLVLPADPDGVEAIASAAAVARGSASVLHAPPRLLQRLLGEDIDPEPSGALLRADLGEDRALAALAVRDLMDRGLRVGVLKRPLGWVASRRALFGLLPPDAPGGLPPHLRARLLDSRHVSLPLPRPTSSFESTPRSRRDSLLASASTGDPAQSPDHPG